MPDEHKCQATEQIDELANFLLKNFQHEFGKGEYPGTGEGAVEMAIRILSQHPELLAEVREIKKEVEAVKKVVEEFKVMTGDFEKRLKSLQYKEE